MRSSPIHSDEQLKAGLRAGDEAAMEQVFRWLYKRLYFFALKVLENQMDAEDVVQDVLLHFSVNAKDKHIVPDNIEGYLFQMVRNRCLNQVRRQQKFDEKTGAIQVQFYADQQLKMDEVAVQEEIFHRIKQEFVRLTPIQLQVMEHLYVNGLSVADTAQRLDTTANNIRNHKARALERLKAVIEKSIFPLIFLFFHFF